MCKIKALAIAAMQHLRSLVLILCVLLASGCGLGAYFLDDGLRLAHDAKTGEYIGELVGERKAAKVEGAKEVTYYQIRRKDGSTVEMAGEQVKLSQP